VKPYNGFLYIAGGDRRNTLGYIVAKTDASGPPPYRWKAVVSDGGFQSNSVLRSPDAFAMGVFQGRLYVGSDRPTEMIRINPDDSWDLVVGYPRQTPMGPKLPISGITEYFGNPFLGHFWNMETWNDQLYMGTWDWSISLRSIILFDTLFQGQYGADMYRTDDGIHWGFVTKTGFGDPYNYGIRSFAPSPFGLFVGSGKPLGGGQVRVSQRFLDLNGGSTLDQTDMQSMMEMVAGGGELPADSDQMWDIDGDGRISVLDVRKLATQCTNPGCRPDAPGVVSGSSTAQSASRLAYPRALEAASTFVVNSRVDLSWEPVPGAASYRVYRSTLQPVLSFFPPEGIQVTMPAFGVDINVPGDFISGRFDSFCDNSPPETLGSFAVCAANLAFDLLETSSQWVGFPKPLERVATVGGTFYSEPAPTNLQSTYFVVAVDENGLESPPSNMVGGPSYAVPTTVATARDTLGELRHNGVQARLIDRLEETIRRASLAASRKDFRRAQAELALAKTQLPEWIAGLGTWKSDNPEEANRTSKHAFLDTAKSRFGLISGSIPGSGTYSFVGRPHFSVESTSPIPIRMEKQRAMLPGNANPLAGGEEQMFVSTSLRDLTNGLSRTIRFIEEGVYPPEILHQTTEELTRRNLTHVLAKFGAEQ
jgi:hypothetical protein